ncbi:UvrD-helicase domain-containing protein [Nocardia farcinica]|uniref:UvrD-helicase domain-containing protein n=1 Tax=Nocardia farcinica TaxID=37329 RepID=UPI001895BF81|nr:UvrD-helicase domain-containing protein [Nocardia farcinica]MBF6577343.1 UvrD-helicase domain-containing protein [Nocardia farcinica]
MPDIHRERRVRWVEQQLAQLPGLDAKHRRFLSVPLMARGWHLFVSRSAPSPGHIAAFAVGRTGAYALVFTDDVPEHAALRSLRKRAEETFGGLLGGRAQFVPHTVEVVLLMPRAIRTEAHDLFVAADESTLHTVLTEGEQRLSANKVREVADALDRRLDWFDRICPDGAPAAVDVAADTLISARELAAQAREEALKRPFREWITFLDPDQLTLVDTNFTGPARISGPAGTGKTVVALHRMGKFARHNPGRLLFTSFVKTLPAYHGAAFSRLAPRAADRAQFTGLHAWTTAFLRRRGVGYNLDEAARDSARAKAWQGAREVLGRVEGTDFAYWTEEIDRVIKGRGIAKLTEYQSVRRTGREGIQLHGPRRKYVWEHWFTPYQEAMKAKGAHDFNDVIRLAVDELRARPLDDTEDYGLVVVDEVQDFTLMELRLVHQIAGGGRDAPLLLVGDGQQQVYAGGWRLSDAGIPISGRGRVLRTNYRNRHAVLQYTKRIEAGNVVDDLDGGPGVVLRDSETTLPGGTVVEKQLRRRDVDAELVRALAESNRPLTDTAVIVGSLKDADHFKRILDRAGLSTLPLDKYDGTQVDPIKVGTVRRAKGIDFAAVYFITEAPADPGGLTPAARDRAELLARQRLVATSRARDHLWVAYVSG